MVIKLKSFVAFLMLVGLLAASVNASGNWSGLGQTALAGEKEQLNLKSSQQLLGDHSPLSPGDSISDWFAMDFALLQIPEDYSSYLARLEQYVSDKYAEDSLLDNFRATEWHRIALAVLALGGNPREFGSKPNGQSIDLIADGTYNFPQGEVGQQGLNGTVYALLALDAAQENSELGNSFRHNLINTILSYQSADGGFGLQSGSADIDITAMALQALAPYSDNEAQEAVLAGLAYLSRNQNPDGSFSSGGKASCESTAQVVLAECALGVERCEEFLKKPLGTPETALLSFALKDGTFGHNIGQDSDAMATAQALLAIAALYRAENGNWVFDFADYSSPSYSASAMVNCRIIAAAAGCAIFVLCIVVLKRRKAAL